MGLAASQARFLGLTARKSDKEYQGQQINQARSDLANQTDLLFQDLLTAKVPNASDYTVTTNQADIDAAKAAVAAAKIPLDAAQTAYNAAVAALLADPSNATLQAAADKAKATLDTAQKTYNAAQTRADGLSFDLDADGLADKYEIDLTNYSLHYNNVSAQIEILHNQDRGLETRLKAIDSEHNEIQTEIDAVKKVIDKNIEGTFKTFG